MRFCKDYSYFNLGISFGDIIGSLVLTINLGFWSFEFVIKDRPETKKAIDTLWEDNENV